MRKAQHTEWQGPCPAGCEPKSRPTQALFTHHKILSPCFQVPWKLKKGSRAHFQILFYFIFRGPGPSEQTGRGLDSERSKTLRPACMAVTDCVTYNGVTHSSIVPMVNSTLLRVENVALHTVVRILAPHPAIRMCVAHRAPG